jgi:hypothetical protein
MRREAGKRMRFDRILLSPDLAETLAEDVVERWVRGE